MPGGLALLQQQKQNSKSLPRSLVSLPAKPPILIRRDEIYESSAPSKPSFKSKFHEQIKQERAQQKLDKQQEHENKIGLAHKKMNYGKFVKEEYMPHVSQKKRIELEN